MHRKIALVGLVENGPHSGVSMQRPRLGTAQYLFLLCATEAAIAQFGRASDRISEGPQFELGSRQLGWRKFRGNPNGQEWNIVSLSLSVSEFEILANKLR